MPVHHLDVTPSWSAVVSRSSEYQLIRHHSLAQLALPPSPCCTGNNVLKESEAESPSFLRFPSCDLALRVKARAYTSLENILGLAKLGSEECHCRPTCNPVCRIELRISSEHLNPHLTPLDVSSPRGRCAETNPGSVSPLLAPKVVGE